MIPSELERLVQKAIAEGKHPYFVNCTSGTTVFGAFDPINELADICDKYNMWLHIDVRQPKILTKRSLFTSFAMIYMNYFHLEFLSEY